MPSATMDKKHIAINLENWRIDFSLYEIEDVYRIDNNNNIQKI